MAKRSFDQAVARILQLDASEGDIAFAMGDETGDQAPIGRDGVNDDTLARLAVATGVDYEVLRQRRFVSSRIPPGTRVPGVAWAVHREIAQVVDEAERSKLLTKIASEPATQFVDGVERPTPRGKWTADAIRTHIGKKAANPAAGSAWGLERAFKEATPEAVAEVLEDPDVRRAVYEGLHKREQKTTERTEREAAADPIRRKFDQQDALLDLIGACNKFADVVEGVMPRLGALPDEDAGGFDMGANSMLVMSLDRVREAFGRVQSFFRRGQSDLDAFIGSVLKEGQ